MVLQTGGLLYRDDVMSKMKDLVDERTRRGRLKIDQKYRNNHSGLHARRHLNVAFFCETTTFISSVDLSSSNRKYKYKTTLSLSRSLLRLTITAALLAGTRFRLTPSLERYRAEFLRLAAVDSISESFEACHLGWWLWSFDRPRSRRPYRDRLFSLRSRRYSRRFEST